MCVCDDALVALLTAEVGRDDGVSHQDLVSEPLRRNCQRLGGAARGRGRRDAREHRDALGSRLSSPDTLGMCSFLHACQVDDAMFSVSSR